MTPIRFLMLGGFLGAGKTTTITRLARHYQAQGHKVGIVTNDQATDLVDTNSLRAQGFEVGEVSKRVLLLQLQQVDGDRWAARKAARPDIVLAEPVGSCTDLVATVVRPLQQLFEATFDVACTRAARPSHAVASCGTAAALAAGSLHLQETGADLIVINRTDELASSEADALTSLLQQQYSGTPVLRMSAKTGAGFEALVEFLDQRGSFGRRVMDVDYDIYAIGEADLGWLNSSCDYTPGAGRPAADIVATAVLAGGDRRERPTSAIGMAVGLYGVASLVSNFSAASCLPSNGQTREAQLVVNARVATAPKRSPARQAAVRRVHRPQRYRHVPTTQSFR
jgi:Ni2+-binding GTPase involved in maturation of urease and hydrogenase